MALSFTTNNIHGSVLLSGRPHMHEYILWLLYLLGSTQNSCVAAMLRISACHNR